MTSSSRMVYQMRLTVDTSQNWGWIFGTEEDEREQDQTFLYTIPLSDEQDDWRKHSYLFPGLKDDQYSEFVAEPQGDTLAVNIPGDYVFFAPYSPLSQFVAPSVPQATRGHLQYLGDEVMVGPFKIFMSIYPLNTIEMDALYRDKAIVLVGLTPNFHPGSYPGSTDTGSP